MYGSEPSSRQLSPTPMIRFSLRLYIKNTTFLGMEVNRRGTAHGLWQQNYRLIGCDLILHLEHLFAPQKHMSFDEAEFTWRFRGSFRPM